MNTIIVTNQKTTATVESHVVEIPDYEAQFNALKELEKTASLMKAESTRAIQICANSVIEQIAIYLHETLKPILQHYEEQHVSLPVDLEIPGSMRLVVRTELGDKYAHRLQLSLDTNKSDERLWVVFTVDKYIIHDENVTPEVVRVLATRWPAFKVSFNQHMSQWFKGQRYKQEVSIRYHQEVIDAVANFKL